MEQPSDAPASASAVDVSSYDRFGIQRPVGMMIGAILFLAIFLPMVRPWVWPIGFWRFWIGVAVAAFGALLLYGVVAAVYSNAVLRRTNPALQEAAYEAGLAEDAARVAAADEASDRAHVTSHPYGRLPLVPIAAPAGLKPLPAETFFWSAENAALLGDVHDVKIRETFLDDERVVDRTSTGAVDRGPLYVSDKRVVFVGAKEFRVFAFDEVALLQALPNGVRIGVPNQPPAQFETGSEKDGIVVLRVSRGLLGALDKSAYDGLVGS